MITIGYLPALKKAQYFYAITKAEAPKVSQQARGASAERRQAFAQQMPRAGVRKEKQYVSFNDSETIT